MSSFRLLLPAALLLVAVTGCGSARLIHATPDGGVVAIPSNSNDWPNHYRREAETLMAQRCPNGYDVIEEGETRRGREYRITFRSRDARPVPVLQPQPELRPVSTLPPSPPPSPPPPGLPPRPVPVGS